MQVILKPRKTKKKVDPMYVQNKNVDVKSW